MLKTRRLVMLLGIFGLILVGCKDNSKNKNTTDDDSSSKTETKNDAYATIQMDDGSTIEMKISKQKGGLGSPTKFSANMTDYKLMVMLKLINSEPIKNKTYKNSGVSLTIASVNKKSALDEMYRSWHFKSADGKEGQAKITFISISKTHAEGTFTGTLYSKSHRKVTIEGKFMTKRKNR
jgi:hypothetical protein